uniref:Putative ribonuclease H-like domain-containing protein n=1 Tax=Tanacetum cinerariifolium TaxID=118510 RepID=A0A699GQN9_TANCI|nr:putative ribonuclease H-like domain-containing protein [Tanacetum cinerariifolium]
MIKVLPPKTAEEVVARERKRKARTTLIMALPEDHLAIFHKMADAKEMWKAIKSRFCGNDESKKMQKYLLKQQFKGFLCLPQRNNLRVFERNVKSTTASSSSNTQNVAFVSTDNTSSTNDVSTAYSVSSPSVSKSQKEGSSSYTDEGILLETAELKGIKTTEEEMLGIKARDNGRRPAYQDDSKALVTIDGEDIDWSGHVEEDFQNYAMMAYSSSNSGSDNKVKSCSKTCEESYARLKKLYDEQREKLGDASVEITAYTLVLKKVEAELLCHQQNQLAYEQKIRLQLMNQTLNLVNILLVGSDSSVETTTSMPAPVENTSKVVCAPKVWTDAPIIEEYKSDSDDDSMSNVQEDKEKPSFVFTNYVKHDDPRRALKDKGVVDSGCSRNMTGNKAHLADYQEFKGGFVAFGCSNGRITAKQKIKVDRLDFEDVYYVEELKHYNLFSVSKMCDKKNKVLFTDTNCLVLSLDFKLPDENQVLFKILRQHNMYSFNLKNIDPSGDLSCLFAKALIDESNKWHRRLGHVNFKNLNKHVNGNLVRGLPSKIFENNHTCVACQKGKQHKASCKAKTVSSVNQPLQILHMDLFGPTSVRSINHKTHCLLITDGFSRFSWVYFLKFKHETTPTLKDFIGQVENQFNHKVKTIRSDNGTKFKNIDLIEFCRLKGIKKEYSNAKTPQQNGVAERKNRTLIEAAKTMLADLFLPTTFWTEAVNTACYVLNRVLVTNPQNKTPYELLTGRQPIISYLRPFGVLVGYSLNRKTFRVYNIKPKRVEENLHVNVLENKPNVARKGHAWMFDLDYLTITMNYEPVLVDNQVNKSVGPKEASAGTQANDNQGANLEEIGLHDGHFVLLIWSAYSTNVKSSKDKIEKNTDFKTCEKPVSQVEQIFQEELEKLKRQEKEANDAARKEATHKKTRC